MLPRLLSAAGLAVGLLLAPSAVRAELSGEPLDFDRTFSPGGEPARLHYRAEFRTATGPHRLEVWRDGERRLKRSADDGALVTYARRRPPGPDFHLTVLDRRRHILTEVGRTNMLRLGDFTEWFDLGHALRRPRAAYQLARAEAPHGAPRPLAPCDWYDLVQQGRETRVCWSARERLPMLITDRSGAPAWRVTSVDRHAFSDAVFRIDGRGFIRNDADRDVEKD